MYSAVEKPNQLLIGDGKTVIVTGWKPRKTIASQLKKNEYAAIGQLYSSVRGLSFLVRNLLANPQIWDVIGLSCTREDKNSGSVQCLRDFFKNGVREGVSESGYPAWIVNSEIPGIIDKEIPERVLNDLRLAVCFQYFEDTVEALATIKTIAVTFKDMLPWGQPRTFPKPPMPKTEVLPASRYGHRIEASTIAEAWVKIIHRIRGNGSLRPTGYDGQWQELIDLVTVVTNEPDEFYFPKPNYLPVDRAAIDVYIPQILEDAPYQEGVKYTYGQRLHSWFGRNQIEQVINKLIAEIDAASAVMSLWDVEDHERGGSPCLNHLWVRVVNSELSLTAVFRSNDMFGAWPSNAMGLRALQQHIKVEIERRSTYRLVLGPLITISQSAHIYDNCFSYADNLIKQQYQRLQQNNRQYNDPVGNFIIERNEKKIVVVQTTPQGEQVSHYCHKDPLFLARQIVEANPDIQPSHAVYLGIELHKAAVDENYQQGKK